MFSLTVLTTKKIRQESIKIGNTVTALADFSQANMEINDPDDFPPDGIRETMPPDADSTHHVNGSNIFSCKYFFSSKSSLRKHIKKIHGDQSVKLNAPNKLTIPPQCNHCKRMFADMLNLRKQAYKNTSCTSTMVKSLNSICPDTYAVGDRVDMSIVRTNIARAVESAFKIRFAKSSRKSGTKNYLQTKTFLRDSNSPVTNAERISTDR